MKSKIRQDLEDMTTEGKIWQDLARYDMVRLSKIWLDMKKQD